MAALKHGRDIRLLISLHKSSGQEGEKIAYPSRGGCTWMFGIVCEISVLEEGAAEELEVGSADATTVAVTKLVAGMVEIVVAAVFVTVEDTAAASDVDIESTGI